MYLSRAYLNPRRAGTQRLLASPQRMHAAVLASFPQQPVSEPDGGGRVLWRVDADNPHRLTLLVVSPWRPDLTHIVEQAGWPSAESPQWESRSYRPLLDKLAKGQRFAFRLVANPTRSVRVADGASRTRRVQHVTAEHQVRWLRERAERHGFAIAESSATDPLTDGEPALDLRLFLRERSVFQRRPGTKVTIQRVGYEGSLEVLDPDALRAALMRGVGHGRAYGCGLLTLAPKGASVA